MRRLLLSLLAYGLLIVGLASLSGGVVALTIPLIVYLVAVLLYRPEKPRLTATRALSATHVPPGAPVVVTLTLTNQGSAVEELLVEDALPPDLRAELEATGCQVITYPPAKDETDLELALIYAAAQADEIVILGALGGRLDHEIANLLLLAHPALENVTARIVTPEQTAFLIRRRTVITGNPGDTVSLIPLGGDAHGVTAQGLRWPLDGETLRFGPARGVSNVLLGGEAVVTVQQGVLLCVVIHGPAR